MGKEESKSVSSLPLAATTQKKKEKRERERERHGFAQAPEEARLERPQVWPWQGLARPKWGQRNLHGQLSYARSLSLSLFLILCSFFFIWFWSCMLFYAMMWLIWFYCAYSLPTCLVAEKPSENIRNGMDFFDFFKHLALLVFFCIGVIFLSCQTGR